MSYYIMNICKYYVIVCIYTELYNMRVYDSKEIKMVGIQCNMYMRKHLCHKFQTISRPLPKSDIYERLLMSKLRTTRAAMSRTVMSRKLMLYGNE